MHEPSRTLNFSLPDSNTSLCSSPPLWCRHSWLYSSTLAQIWCLTPSFVALVLVVIVVVVVVVAVAWRFLFLRVLIRVGGRSPPPQPAASAGGLHPFFFTLTQLYTIPPYDYTYISYIHPMYIHINIHACIHTYCCCFCCI